MTEKLWPLELNLVLVSSKDNPQTPTDGSTLKVAGASVLFSLVLLVSFLMRPNFETVNYAAAASPPPHIVGVNIGPEHCRSKE